MATKTQTFAQQAHHRARRRMPLLLRIYDSLPLALKIPALLIILFIWGPAHVQNLIACLRAPFTRRLRVVSGPALMLITPLITTGFTFCLLDYYSLAPGAVLTWTYLLVALMMYIVMGDDVRFGSWAFVAFVALAAVGALGWFGTAHQIPVFHRIGVLFHSFGIGIFPRQFVLALTVLLSIVYLVRLAVINVVRVLIVDGNLVEVNTIFAKSPANTRSTYQVVEDVRDFAEFMLGASGIHLEAKTNRAKSHYFEVVPAGPLVAAVLEGLLNRVDVEDVEELEPEEEV